MLFAGVTVARRRGLLPLDKKVFPFRLGYRTGTYINQPILEGFIGWILLIHSLPGKCPQVVE